jgi:hypothetical protein
VEAHGTPTEMPLAHGAPSATSRPTLPSVVGIGAALTNRARRIARDDLGLQEPNLAARAGVGLEGFYGRRAT